MQPLQIGYVVARPSVGVGPESGRNGADARLQQLIDDPLGLRRSPHHDPDCAWCAGYRRSIEFGVARTVANLPYRAVAGAGAHTAHRRVAAALDGEIARAASTEALADAAIAEQVRGWLRRWSGDADGGGGAGVGGRAASARQVARRFRDVAYRIAVGVLGLE